MYFQELWSNSKHVVSDSFRSNVCLSPRIAEYQSRVSSSSEKQTEACSISVSSAIDEFSSACSSGGGGGGLLQVCFDDTDLTSVELLAALDPLHFDCGATAVCSDASASDLKFSKLSK